jgi:hypothetical protein
VCVFKLLHNPSGEEEECARGKRGGVRRMKKRKTMGVEIEKKINAM